MSIFNKISGILKADINDLSDKAGYKWLRRQDGITYVRT